MASEPCDACGRDGYSNPAVAVDAVALREGESGTEVLLIRRGGEPWKGMLAFPGGFVDCGEDPAHAVLRELEEETGVDGFDPVALAIHGDPDRDPRKHIIALFYLVDVDPEAMPRGGDDAADAAWVPIAGLTANQVAGSHIQIIEMLRE
tara:strand:+ start:96 stop:542 length:447 start_codon:yes stop_codon:yes gene_type:complete